MRFLKEGLKALLYRPLGVRMGSRSFMLRPFQVEGRSCIAIGSRTSILRGSYLHAIQHYAGQTFAPSIRIGSDVYIGRDVYITAIGQVCVEDHCVLSDGVYLTDEVHGTDPAKGAIMQQHLFSKGPVMIDSGCFLGFRVAILPGVHLGHHCVVGANSTVTRSFPPYSMIAGNPARLIKRYDQEKGEWVAASGVPA